jgi:hypothetical protein
MSGESEAFPVAGDCDYWIYLPAGGPNEILILPANLFA